MIRLFLESWPLFGDTYLAAWVAALLLGLIGVVIVARDQIFVGAAITQASLLGMGIALWAALQPWAVEVGWLQSAGFATALTVVMGMATTLLALPSRHRLHTAEGLTGWIFLFATAMTIVLLAHTPVGQREIDQRLASSIIGATRADLYVLVVVTVAVAAIVAAWRLPLILLVTDPPMARAVGLRVRWLEILMALVVGGVIGYCLRTTGMLYTFGCLVLPGLAAKYACRTVGGLFLVAPLISLATAVVGFVLGYYYDVPPGPLTVVLLALLLPPARLFGYLRKR